MGKIIDTYPMIQKVLNRESDRTNLILFLSTKWVRQYVCNKDLKNLLEKEKAGYTQLNLKESAETCRLSQKTIRWAIKNKILHASFVPTKHCYEISIPDLKIFKLFNILVKEPDLDKDKTELLLKIIEEACTEEIDKPAN